MKNRKFSKKFTSSTTLAININVIFNFDPIIILDVRGPIDFAALGPGFSGPRRRVTKKSF